MKTLGDASIEELVAELRSRGSHLVIPSVWTVEDARGVVDSDDAIGELNLTDEQKDRLAAALFAGAAGIEDILGQRGNDYLADLFEVERETLVAEMLAAPSTSP